MDLWNFIKGGSSVNYIVWIRDLGDDPQDQADPQQIPPQGGPLSDENAAEVRHSRAAGLPASRHSDGDCGPRLGG